MQWVRTITGLFLFSLSLDGYCQTTACLVKAGYSPANDTVISNANPLFFENKSFNASSFSWFINGSFASSQKDFTITPPLGVSEIKLVASDGICSDTSFSYIIWDGSIDAGYGNFQKQYHPAGMAMEPFCIAADKSGGYLLAGDFYLPAANNFISKTTCLMQIDGKGCVTWGKAMVSGELEVIQSVISTSDSGWLISAFPYQSQQNNYPNFLIVFRLDKSGNKEWSNSYAYGSVVNNYYSSICETGDHGFALEIGSFPVAGNPSFISIIKIDGGGRFQWARQYGAEPDAFYNIGGILEKNQFLFLSGSMYDAAPPYDLIRSFLLEVNESTEQTAWSVQNDPILSPVSFTDIHPYKQGLLINSYSADRLNHLLFSDMNGHIQNSSVIDNPYGSLNGKENIVVTPDNGIYFHQSSGNQASGFKDIIMRLDSSQQIRWQYDFSSADLNYTGWFQLSEAPDFGLSGIGSGLLPNGLNAMSFIKLDSAGSGCHSDATHLQLNPDHAVTLPLSWNTDIGFTMQVSEQLLNLNDIPFESLLFCPVFMSGCDLLKLEGPAVVCRPGDTVLYKLHLDPDCSEAVRWTISGQSVSVVDSSQSGRSLRFEKPGEYLIEVEKSGCNEVKDSLIISVGNDIPKINLPGDTVLCFGSTMILDAGAGYTKYLWQDSTENESIEVNEKGLFWVQLTGKNGCISRDTVNIRSVEPLPVSFLPSDTVICAGEPWDLHPSVPFISYSWNTGDTTGSIQVGSAGLYSLKVVDSHGCEGADSILVTTKKCPFGIYFPNAFTPNKDGLNDIFRPVIIGKPAVYKLSIYNRWGQLIFETTDPGQGWDGLIKSGKQESGTYIWTCTYQFNTQEKVIKKGFFLLLR